MILYKLSENSYINQKGTIFLIQTDQLIEGVNLFFAEEEKIFWSKIKIGDEIKFKYNMSPKFGMCALLSQVNDDNVAERRILVHGGNEDGKCTCSNSANCLVPLKDSLSEALDKIQKRIPLHSYTKSWVRTQFERGFERVVRVSQVRRENDEI